MASVIIMPKQGLLMEEGTITKWLVKEGEQTTEGAPLFEMETDKLTITMDSTATGTVLKILHPEGDTVPITQPIAIVGQPGEDISGLLGGDAPAAAPQAAAEARGTYRGGRLPRPAPVVERAPGERVFSSPRARLRAEENGVDIAAVPGSGPDGLVVERDVQNYIANQPAVTPLAANQARVQGIDLSGVTGTGPNGKITTEDLPSSGAAAETRSRGGGRPRPADPGHPHRSHERDAQGHLPEYAGQQVHQCPDQPPDGGGHDRRRGPAEPVQGPGHQGLLQRHHCPGLRQGAAGLPHRQRQRGRQQHRLP